MIWPSEYVYQVSEHEFPKEPTKVPDCKCGKPGQAAHTCPYKEEIGDNYTDLCNCCRDCRQECLYDI